MRAMSGAQTVQNRLKIIRWRCAGPAQGFSMPHIWFVLRGGLAQGLATIGAY